MKRLIVFGCLLGSLECLGSLSGAPAPYGPGSHERFIEEVEQGQTRAYERVMEGYRQAMREAPEDARLVVEGVRFIEYFYYSEDYYIEATEEDHEEFTGLLEQRFPEAPAKILWQLEDSWGEAFDELESQYGARARSWPEAERARFDFLLAQRRNWDGELHPALRRAQASFKLVPTVEAGLLLAELQVALEQREACRETLAHEVFVGAGAWERSQMLDLLFQIEALEDAQKLYQELQDDPDYAASNEDRVRFLVTMGDVEAARAALHEIELNDWNRPYQARRRLDFEMAHGDFASADAAYRELRETGWEADPFMRRRIELFWQFGRVSLAGSDLVGGLALGLFFLLLALFPLGILLPVHYWGLLRERAGKRPVVDLGTPGLRGLWVVLALFVVLEGALLWGFHPAELESYLSDELVETALSVSLAEALSREVGSLLLLALMLLCVGRGRAWPLLGGGDSGVGVGIGMGAAAIIGFKILVVLVSFLWVAVSMAAALQGSPYTTAYLRALYDGGGPLLLIGGVAVLTPIVEELLFRGLMLGAFLRHIPFFWANALQAVLFALIHEDYGLFLYFLAFGLIAGWLTRLSRSLVPALVFHALNNLLAAGVMMAGWNSSQGLFPG